MLTQRTIFLSKRATLEKKFSDAADQGVEKGDLIQCAVAVMVRNAFTPIDLSYLIKDQIRSWFLTNAVARSARKYCIYFREYFTADEWKIIIDQLFDSKEEFLQVTERLRLHIEKLQPMLHSGSWEAQTKQSLVTVFKDENGKKHGWTLSNVDRKYSTQENCELLAILTTLTIFEKDGVRRFTELVKNSFTTTFADYNSENEDERVKVWREHPKTTKEKNDSAELEENQQKTPTKTKDSDDSASKKEELTNNTTINSSKNKTGLKKTVDHQKKKKTRDPFKDPDKKAQQSFIKPKKKKRKKKKRK